MLFREIIAVYSDNHMKYVKTVSGRNVELLNAKSDGTYVGRSSESFPKILRPVERERDRPLGSYRRGLFRIHGVINKPNRPIKHLIQSRSLKQHFLNLRIVFAVTR
jgi:hypothetical protein